MLKFNSLLFKALFSVGLMRFSVGEGGGGGGEGGGSGGGNPPASSSKPGSQTFSYEYVQELREENKSWREKYQAEKGKVAELTTAAEKAGKDADEKVSAADKAASDRILRAELKAHALKAGLVDLDALKLADLTAVKLNDKGEVDGADKLFADLKTAKPYLFGAANTSTPNTPPSNTPPGAVKANEIKDPKEYASAEAAFLAANR